MFSTNLVALRKSVVIDHFCLLITKSTKKRFTLIASDYIYCLHNLLLDLTLFVAPNNG
jgi:hypothetical protein